MYRKGSKGWLKHWDFILLDILCMQAAVTLAHFARFGFRNPFVNDDYWGLSVLLLLADMVTILFFEPFKNVLKRNNYREFAEMLKHVVLVLLVATFYLFSAKEGGRYSRIVFYVFGISYGVLSLLIRILWKRRLLNRPAGEGKRALFLITSEATAEETLKEIQTACYGIFRIAGLAIVDQDLRGREIAGVEVTAWREDITECLMKGWVDEVLINLPDEAEILEKSSSNLPDRMESSEKRWNSPLDGKEIQKDLSDDPLREIAAVKERPLSLFKETTATEEQVDNPTKDRFSVKELVSDLMEMGLVVHIRMQDFSRFSGQKQFIEKIGRSTVLTTSMNYATTGQALVKRTFDILGGLVGCIITGILCILIGPLIYIQSPGPIFFRQERVGKNGKRFWMYKFRSMYLDAEERKAALIKENHMENQMMFKLEFDPRIIGCKKLPDGTIKKGIGNYIRDWSLDEFPQFFNVLKGDMSLVGTRPPTVDEWEKYELHHRGRLAMKPGITGMWQVSGRSKITDFDEVVKLDKTYIQNWSMEQDIRILFRTVGIVLRRDGAM